MKKISGVNNAEEERTIDIGITVETKVPGLIPPEHVNRVGFMIVGFFRACTLGLKDR